MGANGFDEHAIWITGSPWGDLRVHARLGSEAKERVIDVTALKVVGRNPVWGLTADGYAEFRVPCARSELKQVPFISAQIVVDFCFRSGQSWIRLICNTRELEGVFFRFCESLILELSEGTSPTDALTLVLDRFRKLFEQQEKQVLPEKVVGLFAELVVLDRLLETGIDAVAGWLGPVGETHDFIFGGTHLEVKALKPSGVRSFRVSNIHQLESPEDTRLFLVGVKIAPGNHTVGSIVEKIKSRVSLKRFDDFKVGLKAVGCQYPVRPEWNEKEFCAHEPEIWLVNEEFPKLVGSMLVNGVLPSGVSNVQYTVSLEHSVLDSLDIPSVAADILSSKGG